MGGVVNPVGGRLGVLNFWSTSNPLTYDRAVKGSEVGNSVRLLINCWSTVVKRLYRGKRLAFQTNNLVVSVVSNVWGFNSDRLSVYLSFYDYRLRACCLAVIPHRWFFKNCLRFMFRNGLISKPTSLVLNSQQISLWRKRGNWKRSVGWNFRRNIRQYFRKVKKAIGRRIAQWHRLLVIFLKPYLFRLAFAKGFTKLFISTHFQNMSFVGSAVARFLVMRLTQGAKPNYAIKQLRWGFRSSRSKALGYKICLAGRFSRKQIATYRWARLGVGGINQLGTVVDYAYDYGFTRFGAFGLKLWIFYAPNSKVSV